jgi:hypothetical protein
MHTRLTDTATRKRLIATIGLGFMCASLLCSDVPKARHWYGWNIERKLHDKSFGIGRGSPGRKRGVRQKTSLHHQGIWKRIEKYKDDIRLCDLVHLSVSQFLDLVLRLKEADLHLKLKGYASQLVFEDKVILFLHWMVQYPHYSTLTVTYGISGPVISHFLQKALPHFVAYFSTWVKNEFDKVLVKSHLSPHIIGIIDGTVHRIRRPSLDQHLWWNENYHFHAVHSLFIVDFTGKIVAVQTGIPGSFHDSTAARYAKKFKALLTPNLVIGDPGFQGVNYVVAGYKINQLTSDAHKEFDRISRSEQVKIEHVNNFVKKCASLSKLSTFHHNREALAGLVVVGTGWYNYMLEVHGKYLAD